MTLYILPAAIALLIKLFVLGASHQNRKTSTVFFTMVLLFACHNIAEVLGFFNYLNGVGHDQVIRWYYLMTVASLTAIVAYARHVSDMEKTSKLLMSGIMGISVILCAFLMFSDLVVAGSKPIGYTLTAVEGNYYWLFKLFSLISYIVVAWFLVTGYRRSESHKTQIQCGYTLLAFSPLFVMSMVIIALMSNGVEVNASALLPLATAGFLLITLMSERKHGLTDVRQYVPFSLERITSRKILNIFSSYAKDEMNYRDSMAELEKLMVIHKHEKHDGNVSSTAVSMDIPRSSLYSIFRRLEIDHNEEK